MIVLLNEITYDKWTINLLSDDDSDGDLVTDYLSSTNDAQDINNSNKPSKLMAQGSNLSHNNNNNHHNMVPIISVTPHSPGTKYNNILGEWFFSSIPIFISN